MNTAGKVPRAPRLLHLISLRGRQAICTATQRKHTCRARVPSAFIAGRQPPTRVEFRCLTPRLEQTKRDAAANPRQGICAISRMSELFAYTARLDLTL